MIAILIFIVVIVLSLFLQAYSYWAHKKLAGDAKDRILLWPDLWAAVIFSIICMAISYLVLFYWNDISQGNLDAAYFAVLFPAAASVLFTLISWGIRKLEKKFPPDEDRLNLFASRFYRLAKTNQGKIWAIHPRYKPYIRITKSFSQWLLYWMLIVTCISSFAGTSIPAIWYAVPVCALIPVHTFALYLGGIVCAQKEDSVKAKIVKEDHQSQYHLALDHLKETFPEALLYSHEPMKFDKPAGMEHFLPDLKSSGNVNERKAEVYFRNEHRNEQLDSDYIQTAAKILDKRNVIIYNPFFEDLGKYLALPFNESLMVRHKILVVCPGNEEAQRVSHWIKSILDSRNRFSQKWNVRQLEELKPDCDIGILSYSKLYNSKVLQKNRSFFEQCEHVLLLNPSTSLISSQIGLSVLNDLLREGTEPVYTVIDQNLNGLKDTLSHVLKSKFEDECTMTTQAGIQTLMIWDTDADFHTIERFNTETSFLGSAIDLGAEATSIQIPHTTWVGESSVPLVDIQDSASRSYQNICARMNIKPGQHALKEHLRVVPSLWETTTEKASFLIVEDEYHNPFTAARNFRSRGTDEVFLNILSENYLLRDYFCDNAQIFLTNPNAIRTLVPGYAKTERNLLIELIFKMVFEKMEFSELERELSLGGINTHDEANPHKAIEVLCRLLERYTTAGTDVFEISKVIIPSVCDKPEIKEYVSINPDKFEKYFAKTLKNATFVLEDETLDQTYLNAKLYTLIPQTMLPGQFITFEGKNYFVKQISPKTGVILNRASDRADSRKSYRQRREYHLDPDAIALTKSERINGFTFIRGLADIEVKTNGYQETESRNGSIIHREHFFSDYADIENLSRQYKNKSVLRIQFPDIDQEQLCQISALLQELLPTVIPDGSDYLAVLVQSDKPAGDGLFDIRYSFPEARASEIIIVEDSEIDLGLLDIMEKYFFDFMAIIQDYLRWRLDHETEVE